MFRDNHLDLILLTWENFSQPNKISNFKNNKPNKILNNKPNKILNIRNVDCQMVNHDR